MKYKKNEVKMLDIEDQDKVAVRWVLAAENYHVLRVYKREYLGFSLRNGYDMFSLGDERMLILDTREMARNLGRGFKWNLTPKKLLLIVE